MAGFADALPLLQPYGHQFGEFSVVRILVAGFARDVSEMIFPVGAGGRIFFAVAILAGHGGVRAFQRECR